MIRVYLLVPRPDFYPTNKKKLLMMMMMMMMMCFRCPCVAVEWTVLVHSIKQIEEEEEEVEEEAEEEGDGKKSSLKRSIMYQKQATAYKRTYTKMFSMFYFSTMCTLQLLLLLLLLLSCCFTNRPVVQPVACVQHECVSVAYCCLPTRQNKRGHYCDIKQYTIFFLF